MFGKNKLSDIAAILRRDSLIATTEAKSGHPSSCLSAAEIMAVLFFDEMRFDPKNPSNPNNDNFILSKGHAAPILYSSLFRSKCISSNLKMLRKLNSPLEGHPVPRSLPWVQAATGSLGQGLGVGVGIALGAKLQGKKFRTYVLLGDSEMAEGSVYEALEIAAKYKLNNLVAIIDVNRLGQRGETMIGHNIGIYQKRVESFGCKAFIVDGHNISSLQKALKKAKKSLKPVVIIAQTLKGKSVSFIQDKEGWHGRPLNREELLMALAEIPEKSMPSLSIKSPFLIKWKPTKSLLKRQPYLEAVATRKAYGETLASLGSSDSSILSLDAETSNSTYAEDLKKIKPEQFVECYIAEQNMISMALGLSKLGFRVFSSTFSAFLSRAHDQIRMAALSSAHMTIVGSHAGVSIGQDGCSQMGLEDISLFRSLPDSTVLYPSDGVSARELTITSSKIKGVSYLRTTRQKTPILYQNSEKFPLGDFKVLKKSSKDKAVFVGSGITVHEALQAYQELQKKKINVAVIDLYSIKPFNHSKFNSFIKRHGNRVILAEDHRKEGGIGEMISSGLVGTNISMKHLFVEGIPHSGEPRELLKKNGIDSKAYVLAFKK